jgi:ubiquinol-cytochrome c reductase cytochrome b subunit
MRTDRAAPPAPPLPRTIHRRPRRPPWTHQSEAGVEGPLRPLLKRAVPSHWTVFLASVWAACLVVLIVTGVFLLFYYDPSNETVIYHGSYPLLRGTEVSKAFNSTLQVSFEVRAGLLMRQAHHWAALLLPAALMLHMLSLFFTGGFRRPRQWGWVLLSLIFVVCLAGGWSGYALPDDDLSATGLRIFEGILLSIPVVGTSLTGLVFGGEYPGGIVTHLYWLHVLVVPLMLALLVAIRLRLARKRRPAQFAGPGRAEDNVVGLAASTIAVRAGGLFLITAGVLFAMAGTLSVSPAWLHGPATSSDASSGSQPDWYTSFLDGALRLVPPGWEFTWLGGTWSLGVLVPQVVGGSFVLIVVIYPFLEARLTGDRQAHNILDRPRNAPNRTGLGVAGLVFFGSLWAAAGTDVIATHFHVPFETEVYVLRFSLLAGPFMAYWLTREICLGLQARDWEEVRHGFETGILQLQPNGAYVEDRAPLPPARRWRLAAGGVGSPSGTARGAPSTRPGAEGDPSVASTPTDGSSN